MNDDWRRVGALATLVEGRAQRVEIETVDILLLRIGGVVHAVHNRCTHADACLHEGRVRGHRIICPLHGASFDARTGAALAKPATESLRRYQVREADGDIYVLLGAAVG